MCICSEVVAFFMFLLGSAASQRLLCDIGQGQFSFYCTNPRRFFMFLLLLISTHEMRRLTLMVNDVNSFTDISHQHQPIILKRLKSVNVFYCFCLFGETGLCKHSDIS